MSYRFDFDPTHQVLRGQLEGPIDDEVLVEFYKEIGRQCARICPQAGVADCSAVTSMAVIAHTVRSLAKSPSAVLGPEKPRFIVAPAPSVFGLARLFQLEGEATLPNLHVVRSLREVCAVMGIQKLRFESMAAG